MVTIKNAWIKQGYSRMDHLNGDVSEHVGRQFRSVGEARKAIFRASRTSGANPNISPIGLEVLFADGTTREF